MKTAFFCKTNIFDTHAFGGIKIDLRSKTTIKCCLEGDSTIDLILPIEHLFYQFSVSWVAVFNGAIGNEI